MFRLHEEARAEFEIICLEDFIPEDHLLRKIAAHIDFSFIWQGGTSHTDLDGDVAR